MIIKEKKHINWTSSKLKITISQEIQLKRPKSQILGENSYDTIYLIHSSPCLLQPRIRIYKEQLHLRNEKGNNPVNNGKNTSADTNAKYTYAL